MAEGDPNPAAPAAPAAPAGGSIDDKVSDSGEYAFEHKARRFLNKLFLAGGASALTGGILGAKALLVPSAFAGSGGVINAIKGKPLVENIEDTLTTYAAVSTVLPGMDWLGGATFSKFASPLIKTAYAIGPYNMAFSGSFLTVKHLYDNNLNPEGMSEYLKEHFGPTWKRFAWIFLPGYAMAANGVSSVDLPFNIPGVGKTVPTFFPNAVVASGYGAINPSKTTSERKAIKEARRKAYEAEANPDYNPTQQDQPQLKPGPDQGQYRLPQNDMYRNAA